MLFLMELGCSRNLFVVYGVFFHQVMDLRHRKLVISSETHRRWGLDTLDAQSQYSIMSTKTSFSKIGGVRVFLRAAAVTQQKLITKSETLNNIGL